MSVFWRVSPDLPQENNPSYVIKKDIPKPALIPLTFIFKSTFPKPDV